MPSGVVTVMSTVPVPAGLVAVILVALATVKLVAGVEPKSTALVPWKLLPLIVTVVPPTAGPLAGATVLIRGGRHRGQQQGCDRRGLVAAVVVGRFAPGCVGMVTGEDGGEYCVSPRIAGKRSGVEDRRGGREGHAVVIIWSIRKADADGGQAATAIVLCRAREDCGPAGGQVAGEGQGGRGDAFASDLEYGAGQYEVSAARGAPTLEAQGALLNVDRARVIDGERDRGRAAACGHFEGSGVVESARAAVVVGHVGGSLEIEGRP